MGKLLITDITPTTIFSCKLSTFINHWLTISYMLPFTHPLLFLVTSLRFLVESQHEPALTNLQQQAPRVRTPDPSAQVPQLVVNPWLAKGNPR